MDKGSGELKVWDAFVRIGHWALVIGFSIAYLTEDDLETLHVWAGYLVGAIVLFRIIWGFVGTKHARFKDFLFSPITIVKYFWKMVTRFEGKRYVGHSPAGGAMVLALLLGLAASVWSGLVLYAIDENSGPLASFVSSGIDERKPAKIDLISNAYANGEESDDDEHENDEDEFNEKWEELHEVFANLTLFLVILHVGGVLLASYIHKENLVQAMLRGYKRREE